MLASLALGLDDEWAHSALLLTPRGGFPPEPIRYVGAHVVRAGSRAEGTSARTPARRPGRLDHVVAGLAPAGLVPVKKKT